MTMWKIWLPLGMCAVGIVWMFGAVVVSLF